MDSNSEDDVKGDRFTLRNSRVFKSNQNLSKSVLNKSNENLVSKSLKNETMNSRHFSRYGFRNKRIANGSQSDEGRHYRRFERNTNNLLKIVIDSDSDDKDVDSTFIRPRQYSKAKHCHNENNYVREKQLSYRSPTLIRRSNRNKKPVYSTLNQSLICDQGISDYENVNAQQHKRCRESNDEEEMRHYDFTRQSRGKRIKRDLYGMPILSQSYNYDDDDDNGAAVKISSRELRLKKRDERRKESNIKNSDNSFDTVNDEQSNKEKSNLKINIRKVEKVDNNKSISGDKESDGNESDNDDDDDDDDDRGDVNDNDDEENTSRKPRQYFLRERRPTNDIVSRCSVNRSSTMKKTDQVYYESSAIRKHKRELRNKKIDFQRFFNSPKHHSTTICHNSSSSTDFDDNSDFERRKAKSMAKARNRCLPLNFTSGDLKPITKDRMRIGSSLADIDPMLIDKEVNFDLVKGLSRYIRRLKEMVLFPLLYPEFFDKFGTEAPKGVLFYGPPGTGKTLVARALANECSKRGKKVAFFMRKGADCLSKWVGESERQLRLLFDQAFQMRPSIIFFDEIDGLAPVRSSKQDQIHSSIVSTLLALMDGVDSRGEIVIIGATNRLDSIDPALRRPGRFDRELFFPLPNYSARKDILKVHTRKWQPPLDENFLNDLASKCVGYSGADLKAVCTESCLRALKRTFPQVYKSEQKLLIDINSINVVEHDFNDALSKIIPTSARCVKPNGKSLPKRVKPLLLHKLNDFMTAIQNIFPSELRKSKVNDDESDEETPSVDCLHRPRLILNGENGSGLYTYLAPAILDLLEIPIYTLDSLSINIDTMRAAEDCCANIVKQAKCTNPCVIYMPKIDEFDNCLTSLTKTILINMINELEATLPILLFATCSNLNGIHLISEIFSDKRTHYKMPKPSIDEIKKFLNPIIVELCKEPGETNRVKNIPELPVVEIPEKRQLTEVEQKAINKKNIAVLRELRLFLRSVINKLSRDRKFTVFTKPVDKEEVPDYYEIIKEPMDLSKMMTKIDLEEYETAKAFLKDIDLICYNALEYNPPLDAQSRSIRHRACALKDTARGILENELDTEFEEMCDDIYESKNKSNNNIEKNELNDKSLSISPQRSLATVEDYPSNISPPKDGERIILKKIRKPRSKPRSISSPFCKPTKVNFIKNFVKVNADGKELARYDSHGNIIDTSSKSNDLKIDGIESNNTNSMQVDVLEKKQSLESAKESVNNVLIIDKTQLYEVMDKIAEDCRDMNVENLLFIYSRLARIVNSFKLFWDRSTVPDELRKCISVFS